MRAFHVLSYLTVGASLFFSAIYFSASVLAILWYFCYIGEDTGSRLDLMKFIYFRSSHCNAEFHWKYLGLSNATVVVETSSESYFSQKTLIITISYLVVNFALIATAIVAIYGLNRQRGGKYFNFYALCLPWIVMNFVGLVIDVSAAINYFGDYMSVLWDITVLLEMLAVQNVEEVRPILTDRHQTVIYPTAMAIQNMYLAASKMFLPLLYLFMFGLLSIKSMWQVVSENKRIQVHLARS